MSDLVERVARAINATCYDGCDAGEDNVRACVDPPCPCRAAARAAIAIVRREALEEAARVVDRGHCTASGCETYQGGDREPWHSNLCPVGIAAAIRALMEPGDE